jgi:hypothetical protein
MRADDIENGAAYATASPSRSLNFRSPSEQAVSAGGWPTVSLEGLLPISGSLAPAAICPLPMKEICANRPWSSITRHIDRAASVGMQASPLMFVATSPSSSVNGAVI